MPDLPAQHLAAAFEGSLAQVIETLAEPEPIIKACYRLAPNIALHLCDIAFIRILKGHLDEAATFIKAAIAEEKKSRANATCIRLRAPVCTDTAGLKQSARRSLPRVRRGELQGNPVIFSSQGTPTWARCPWCRWCSLRLSGNIRLRKWSVSPMN